MIRYYAYYSCGGYKDLYLGNSSLKTEYTYFLPLLATWLKGTKPEYAEKLKKVEGLTQIEVISKENYFDFPQQAKNLFSHGGYRVIYLTLSNGDTCLCVRDITNGAKDEDDRDIPFNILITASGENDVKILDQFCLDSLKQPNGFYGLMSPLFSYDPQVNGIKFYLGKLNSTIYDAPIPNKELEHKPNHVNFLIIDSAAMASTALNELDLNREQIDYIKSKDGKCSGSLEYKVKPVPIELMEEGLHATKSNEEVRDSSPKPDIAVENLSENKETSTLEEPPVQTLNHEPIKDESLKQESIDEVHSIKEEELHQQFIDIQRVLRDLTKHVKNIGEKLGSSGSSLLLNDEMILDKINSLKNEVSKQLPIIPEQPKEDNSIRISKIHLWIAGVSLIVGFLLGALIF
jgi:hypothetical protein